MRRSISSPEGANYSDEYAFNLVILRRNWLWKHIAEHPERREVAFNTRPVGILRMGNDGIIQHYSLNKYMTTT
ncbi:hypothetical protein AWI28_11405 [Enterobacter genomosp. O]|uniref:Uncharacterized protein n=1 Tax=Enterobacter genomosp. O TaxID=2364150 RepID=A0A0X4EUM5_9ENTR|nr:hypothetical protein AWI28_11405 [Enterobacter genomosp. O]